ncbi:MAG TPA: D-aminoacyl-tRNA deacylase [Smithellaceae bacterium]|jgi:D-tyrosyl-tRNA(Tyr) deacylase|nr:MAG: D-tyrosyl-tRNA(Tyr) deacylase [Deltaproteobacteria bacterium ADurb.BinA014]HNQ17797.1 D-aminoacyl-tRNA deacylase [Smithellaceae bacterium]HNT90208.1 D-aminoacyl-tRNA deacylase [Smithellaceae bacterium]HNV63523.1 D-aminoacyl-tRNA deacylase [Smithellaceae bacterium]HNZ30845.1 D-aminoacyl-tRNA deacylase [Smithellaceae bacterium]
MKAVIQRVDCAGVKINQKELSSIKSGILIFLGVEKGDVTADADYILDKAINLRIFEDNDGKMNLGLVDIGGEMLVVSQFTLLADCRKGRRPSFTGAEEPAKAEKLYDYFIDRAKEKIMKVASGRFQEIMSVELINNGPVTILLDSRKNI